MSAPAPSPAVEIPAPGAPDAATATLLARVHKYAAGKNAQLHKLLAENAALKAALAAERQANSRVRRIPKRAAAPVEGGSA